MMLQAAKQWVDKILAKRLQVSERLEILKGFETVTAAAAVSVEVPITYMTSAGGTVALTLANGYEGQVKILYYSTHTNNVTLTPANLTGYTTVTFDASYEYWIGVFHAGSWVTLITNATLA